MSGVFLSLKQDLNHTRLLSRLLSLNFFEISDSLYIVSRITCSYV